MADIILKHLKSHWAKYVMILLVVGNVMLANTALALKDDLKVATNITQAKIDEVQEFNAKLGLAESDLRTQKQLADKYKKELSDMDSDVKDLISKYDLKLKDRDSSVSFWKGKAKGGKQSTVITKVVTTPDKGEFETVVEIDVKELCGDNVIGYNWQDTHKRFTLKDPDISKSGDEEFEYKQYVSVKGYVFSDSSGQLQVKKVEVRELLRKETEGGEVSYIPVEGQKVSLVKSKFEYINKTEEPSRWTDLFGLRLMGVYDTRLYPGIGLEIVNFGRWLDWANVGVYGKVSVNPFDGLAGLQKSTVGAGILYHLIPPLLDTNLAIGVSINTPFDDLGRMVLGIDAIFYLTN